MKKLLCLALNIFMVATLVGCGGKEKGSDEFTPSLDRQTKCNIRVVGSYSNFEALETEFDRFNVFYPKVNLEYVKLDKYETTLSTVLDGDDKPNIFFSEPKMMNNESYASIVAHMEDLSDEKLKINLDCIRPSLIKTYGKGKIYMVPIFSKTSGMLVNKNLFNKENLEIPTTYAELLNVCAKFKEKEYANPIMGYTKDNKPSSGLMNAIAYPYFIAELSKDSKSLELANNLDPQAGEYMRKGLTVIDDLIKKNYINIEACDQIGDNYEKLLFRFFENDVPMMVCNGDIVSGAKKRETKDGSPFKNNPFKYSFVPIPVTEEGGFFIDSPSVEFSVNKDCDNLDMTNEFMKFLVRTKELDEMASEKGLITPTKTIPFEPNYAAFNDVPAERTISPEVIGAKDTLATQIRIASYQVGKGEISIDDAVKKYGQFK